MQPLMIVYVQGHNKGVLMKQIFFILILLLCGEANADQKMSAYTTQQPALTDTDIYIKDPSGSPANRKGTVASHFLAANMTVDGTNVGIGSPSPQGRLDIGTGSYYGDGSHITGVSGISGLTTNYVPKASSPTAITNSLLYDDGTNIGVGTILPNRRLEIVKSDSGATLTSGSGAAVGIVNQSSTDNSFVDYAMSTVDSAGSQTLGAKISGVFTSHTAGAVSGDIVFLNKNSGTTAENMRINSSGNVGIGTSNPTTAKVTIGAATTGAIFSTKSGLSLGNDFTSGASPSAIMKLKIYENDIGGDFGLNKTQSTNMASSGAEFQYILGAGTTNNSHVFYYGYGVSGGPTELMRIVGTGNVGIGTFNPSSRLNVWGANTGITRAFTVNDSSSNPLFNVVNNGNVGVGTLSPSGGFVLGSGVGFQTVGIGTTVPQLPCIKGNRTWGYYDPPWSGLCN